MFGTTRCVHVCRHRRSRERLGRSRAHDGYIARCLGDHLRRDAAEIAPHRRCAARADHDMIDLSLPRIVEKRPAGSGDSSTV